MHLPHKSRPRQQRPNVTMEAMEGRLLLTSIVVNSLSDATALPSGSTDLRMAVAAADSSTTPTTITFNPTVFSSHKTIVLINGTLTLNNRAQATTITGPSAGVTVNANGKSTVLSIVTKATVTLSRLTITGGKASNGGGISNAGNMTATNVTIAGNSADVPVTNGGVGGRGGGLYNTGTATLIGGTVSGNTATYGGAGIENDGTVALIGDTIAGNTAGQTGLNYFGSGGGIRTTGTAKLINDTIAQNNSGSDGGGISVDGGTATLSNVTIVANYSTFGGGIATASHVAIVTNNSNFGGGIHTSGGIAPAVCIIGNSVIAGNHVVQNVVDSDANASFNSLGNNLIGNADDSAGLVASDRKGTSAHPLDPKLGALAFNGGPTQTMLPLLGSPLINAGSNALVPTGTTTDQRGLPRIVMGNVDIGAVEVQSNEVLSGTVFNDPNKNGKQDSGDAGLAGWKIYDDVNNVGYFVSGDPFTFTNASGAYALSVLATGTAHLRQLIPANWSQTGPAGNAAISVVLNAAGKSGLNFGDVSSIKYLSTVATMPGIVAWWTFDVQSQANSILNGYTGTLNGGATIANVGPPLVGEASSYGLSLNGSSAFVNTNLTTQQEFTTAATVNVWVNLGSTPPKSGHIWTIAAKSQFGNDLDLQVETDGKVHFYTDRGSSASFTPTSLTGWHMVTAEFDTASKVRNIFWDGQLVASTNPYTGGHSASTQAFSIGASDVFAGRFFNGKIDEVTLWNRALTAAQVLAIYNASK